MLKLRFIKRVEILQKLVFSALTRKEKEKILIFKELMDLLKSKRVEILKNKKIAFRNWFLEAEKSILHKKQEH